MNRNERKNRINVFNCAVATAALVLMSGATLAGETAGSAYTMSVIKNEAFGQTFLSGEYEKGIAKIQSYIARRAESFAAKNNLCVAYTLTGKFDQAAPACEAAISKSKQNGRQENSPLNPYDDSRDLALAYSNRGVLRAVSGDIEGAIQDFEYAAEVNTDLVAAAENLAYLKAPDSSGE